MFGVDTLAKAQKQLEDHKNRTYKPEQAYDWAIRLAEYEGMVEMFTILDQIEAHGRKKGVSEDRIAFHLLEEIVNRLALGADDTWSGRGNERKRAYFDGVREAAREARYGIKRMFDAAQGVEED